MALGFTCIPCPFYEVTPMLRQTREKMPVKEQLTFRLCFAFISLLLRKMNVGLLCSFPPPSPASASGRPCSEPPLIPLYDVCGHGNAAQGSVSFPMLLPRSGAPSPEKFDVPSPMPGPPAVPPAALPPCFLDYTIIETGRCVDGGTVPLNSAATALKSCGNVNRFYRREIPYVPGPCRPTQTHTQLWHIVHQGAIFR